MLVITPDQMALIIACVIFVIGSFTALAFLAAYMSDVTRRRK